MKYFAVGILCLITGGMYGYGASNIVSVRQTTIIRITDRTISFSNNRYLEGDVFEIYKNGVKVQTGKMTNGEWR